MKDTGSEPEDLVQGAIRYDNRRQSVTVDVDEPVVDDHRLKYLA